MELIRDLCVEFDVVAITDEIYQHIIYDGTEHVSLATLDGMRERTITINGMSKTYSVTGWRVGWAVAPPVLTSAIRKVHDFLTVGAAAPLQEAGAAALLLPVELLRLNSPKAIAAGATNWFRRWRKLASAHSFPAALTTS